nr:MAG TPA: hypothetical protein [Caudoviricetes sp.]
MGLFSKALISYTSSFFPSFFQDLTLYSFVLLLLTMAHFFEIQ